MYCDKSYFRRRALDERGSAACAADSGVRTKHEELASRFEDLAEAIAQRDYLLGLDLYADDPTFDPRAPAGKLARGLEWETRSAE
jgi:hypothetical protein